jgi:FMN phosphatase YigB (HAD superfamily)
VTEATCQSPRALRSRRPPYRVAREFKLVPREIAYVGVRVDNDVLRALAAGMTAVHVRRGPWGYLHDGSVGHLSVSSLLDIPDALTSRPEAADPR